MAVDRRFLKEVQGAGWLIEQASAEAVLARCPRPGCNLTVAFKPEVQVQPACKTGPDMTESPVNTFDDVLALLVQLRDALGLNILETEECVGLAQGHLAKIESAARLPNFQTVIDIASAFGIQFVARRGPLPARTIAVISETRHRTKNRRLRPSRRP